jgi:flavin reductase (DIM6/NTAB) family NADH-FMN oxidoreductase RutF
MKVTIHHVGVIDESFDDLMLMLDTPVFVVTTQADGHPSGCLVGFATQAGIDPSRFLVGIGKGNHTFGVASRSEHLAVHVLARRHHALAELFGAQTGNEINKFDRCSWRAGPKGMPILDDAIAWFVGRTVNRVDVGDHVAFVLEPVDAWAPESSEEPLYLSDVDDIIDDDDDGGHPDTQRGGLFEPGWERGVVTRPNGDVARRYGVRFTIGGL